MKYLNPWWAYSFARIWNIMPYGYLGYRLENKTREFIYRNNPVRINKMDGKYYAHYLPCGKHQKWWEIRVEGPDSIITLKELMKKKWMREITVPRNASRKGSPHSHYASVQSSGFQKIDDRTVKDISDVL